MVRRPGAGHRVKGATMTEPKGEDRAMGEGGRRPDPVAGPVADADDGTRAEAQALIRDARFGTLAFTHPDDGLPFASRIALAPDAGGGLLACLSAIALHSRALTLAPDCALLLGEPGPKGDPLTHARLSLRVHAEWLDPADGSDAQRRAAWRTHHPKSAVYLDLPDFRFVRLTPRFGLLNGGFGRAARLGAGDLRGADEDCVGAD